MSDQSLEFGCGGACVCSAAGGQGVGRRVFLSRSVLAAAALALAACGGEGGEGGGPTAPSQEPATVKLADHPSLANVGGVAVVTVKGARIALVRTGTSEFIGLSLTCPHQGGSINATDVGFTCSLHGARFNRTGGWVGGQPTSNMTTVDVAYNASSGVLTIG